MANVFTLQGHDLGESVFTLQGPNLGSSIFTIQGAGNAPWYKHRFVIPAIVLLGAAAVGLVYWRRRSR